MLTKDQAQTRLEKAVPGVTVKACATFDELYLFRVEFPMPLEENWDPFFSVDTLTGEVRDFGIVSDIDISDALKLEWHDI